MQLLQICLEVDPKRCHLVRHDDLSFKWGNRCGKQKVLDTHKYIINDLNAGCTEQENGKESS